jgi:hypothetical protein
MLTDAGSKRQDLCWSLPRGVSARVGDRGSKLIQSNIDSKLLTWMMSWLETYSKPKKDAIKSNIEGAEPLG